MKAMATVCSSLHLTPHRMVRLLEQPGERETLKPDRPILLTRWSGLNSSRDPGIGEEAILCHEENPHRPDGTRFPPGSPGASRHACLAS